MRIQAGLAKLFIAGFLMTLSFQGISQEKYEPGKVIPPSPTAASLGVYGEYKVGYYTGTPDITIPLYTVKTGHNMVPMFMKYNASGFRVSEQAGWVGLGWSLNAGGVITKTVRGADDFGNNGYYSAAALPTAPTQLNKPYFDNILNMYVDAEADIYSYNFGNYSGRFVHGKKLEGSVVYMADRNNLKVAYDQTTSKWTIITPDGYTYVFDTEERQQNFNYYAPNLFAIGMGDPISPKYQWDQKPDAITAWYLNSITAPNGETITFTYEIRSFSIGLTNRTDSKYNMVHYNSGGCSAMPPFQATVERYAYSKQIIGDVYLTKITFDNGSIDFSTTDRDDIEYSGANKPQKLSTITVKDKAGNQFKKYQFDYAYFTGASTRLRLNSITEFGSNNEAKPPYLFNYNNPTGLPPLYTNSIDHWGFLNNETNIDGLIPPVLADGLDYFPGARRVPDGSAANLEKLKAAVLSSITYPTGGATNFEYEMNEYRNLTGEDKYDIMYDRYSVYAWDGDPMSHGVAHFDLTEPTDVEFTWSYQDIDENQGGQMAGVQRVFGYCDQQGVGQISSFSNWDPVAGQEAGEQPQHRTKFLLPGHYTISVVNVQGYFTDVAVSFYRKFPVSQRKGGGLRVKTITNYDNGQKVSVKKYSYSLDDAGTQTSGLLIRRPIYSFMQNVFYAATSCGSYARYVGRTSSSLMPPNLTAGGALVGYDRVVETIGDNGEGGRNEYYFHNLEETIVGDGSPFVNGYLDPKNGKLAVTLVKNAAGDIVQMKESFYDLKQGAYLNGIKVFQPPFVQAYTEGVEPYAIWIYQEYSNWLVTREDKETIKQPGSPDIVTSTKYFYDNADHLQLTRKETVKSDGKTEITKFRYPGDYTSAPASSWVVDMKNKNMVTAIIDQQKLIKTGQDEKLIGGVFTEYGLTNSLYQPAKIYKAETREPSALVTPTDINSSGIVLNPLFKEEVTFDQYDAKGNLSGYHKVGDAFQCYIWDQTISMPVAQAANAAADQVAFTSFETSEKGNWDFNISSYVSGDGITGKQSLSISGGNVISKTGLNTTTTYIVSYWSKTGGIQVNGIAGTARMSKKGWTYYENRISNATVISVTGSGQIDELRLRPVNVPMKTYTYDPLMGITSECDQNNRIVYYEYDGFARLLRIRDADNNILKQYDYKYH